MRFLALIVTLLLGVLLASPGSGVEGRSPVNGDALRRHGGHSHDHDQSTGDNDDDPPYGLAWGLNICAAVSTLIGASAVLVSERLRNMLMDPASPLLVSLLSVSMGVLLWVSLVALQPESAKMLSGKGIKGPNLISSAIFFAGWGFGHMLQRMAGSLETNTPQAEPVPAITFDTAQDMTKEEPQLPPAAEAPPAGNRDCCGPAADTHSASGIGHGGIFVVAEVAPEQTAAANVATKPMLDLACHTAMSLGLHNFAEGFVSFVAVIASRKMGVATAIAIMLHNVPEGFVIAVPAYAATKSWKQPVLLTGLSTLAEILAGLVGFTLVWAVDDVSASSLSFTWLYAVLSSLAAGLMAQAALGSLLPHCLEMERQRQLVLKSAAEAGGCECAHEHGNGVVMTGTLVGMGLMALILGLFDLEEIFK